MAAVSNQDFVHEFAAPTWLITPSYISAKEPVVAALRAAHRGIFDKDPGWKPSCPVRMLPI